MFKKGILSTIILLAHICNAQWSQQFTGYNFNFTDVTFIDSVNGIIASYDGLLVTHDGGGNWTLHSYPDEIYDVDFVNDSIVYAIGTNNDSVVFKSYNGGDSWKALLYSYSPGQEGDFINKDTGIIVTGNLFMQQGSASTTKDGGVSWQSSNFEGPFFWAKMFTSDSLKIMGQGTSLPGANFGESIDNGLNWEFPTTTFIFSDELYPWKRTYFFDWLHGLYLLNREYESLDGGATWNEVKKIDTTVLLTTIGFADNKVGYIAGNDALGNLKIYSTSDSGKTWIENLIDINTTETVFAFHCLDENHCYAVGTNGLFLKTTNGGGVSINEIDQSNFMFTIYPNPATSQLEIILPQIYRSQRLIITNTLGQLIKQQEFSSNQISVEIANLPAGIYFLEVQIATGSFIKKFVKE